MLPEFCHVDRILPRCRNFAWLPNLPQKTKVVYPCIQFHPRSNSTRVTMTFYLSSSSGNFFWSQWKWWQWGLWRWQWSCWLVDVDSSFSKIEDICLWLLWWYPSSLPRPPLYKYPQEIPTESQHGLTSPSGWSRCTVVVIVLFSLHFSSAVFNFLFLCIHAQRSGAPWWLILVCSLQSLSLSRRYATTSSPDCKNPFAFGIKQRRNPIRQRVVVVVACFVIAWTLDFHLCCGRGCRRSWAEEAHTTVVGLAVTSEWSSTGVKMLGVHFCGEGADVGSLRSWRFGLLAVWLTITSSNDLWAWYW